MSLICENIGTDGEVPKNVTKSSSLTKDNFDDEELDYEEEDEDTKIRNEMKFDGDIDGDGELSDDDAVKNEETKIGKTDKDEGELDDDDLEEGEVKDESDSEKTDNKSETENVAAVKRPNPVLLQENRNLPRRDARQSKIYNNTYWPTNQSYGTLRYPIQNRTDRHGNIRPREYVNTTTTSTKLTSESAWERGLKQARELISMASKRKEEVDYEQKRSSEPQLNRERSPLEKRRRLSNSSSEDEVERRHRLAYDAAPWNQSSNNRNRTNPYTLSRSAEAFRDPWRRSKSPKPVHSRDKRFDVDNRYPEDYKKEKGEDFHKSNSMSSLSSICSNSSNHSINSKSSGRKLPYLRPNLDTKYDQENDLPYQNRDFVKSKMDRIPKKSNASHYQSNDRHSDNKSFDSWSESLSESDSETSYFTNSGSDSENSNEEGEKRSFKKGVPKSNEARSRVNKQQPSEDLVGNYKKTKSHEKMSNAKYSKYANDKDMKKAPIKMTFMKKQTSLKKDKLIDEQLNGEISDEDLKKLDPIPISPKDSSQKSIESISEESFDESETKEEDDELDDSTESKSSKTSRKKELLSKLRAIEEAINRKLSSNN